MRSTSLVRVRVWHDSLLCNCVLFLVVTRFISSFLRGCTVRIVIDGISSDELKINLGYRKAPLLMRLFTHNLVVAGAALSVLIDDIGVEESCYGMQVCADFEAVQNLFPPTDFRNTCTIYVHISKME